MVSSKQGREKGVVAISAVGAICILLLPPIQDLPFKKGEKLVIVAPSKDPNWYKARREDGLEGMIPFNYVQEKVSAGTPAPPPPQRPVQPSPPTADNDAAMNHVAKGAVQLKTMP